MKAVSKNGLCIALIVFWACGLSDEGAVNLKSEYPQSFTVTLKNQTNVERIDESVVLMAADLKEMAADFNQQAFVILDDAEEIPSQFYENEENRDQRGIALVTNFSPDEEKTLTVRYAKTGMKSRSYDKRTQAELSQKFGGHWQDRKYLNGEFRNVEFVRVPAEHTDHSFFFRYEGPGWESDKVGYRFYLDWRNATDIFGKKTASMVLQDVGLDGFDSYHEMADWGMDVLKVGESLGIGSIGMWHDDKVFRVSDTDSITCNISANGPLYSSVRTNYFGWQVGSRKFDLTSNLSISAGSRLTRHMIKVIGNPENLCTGLVKHENAELIQSVTDAGEWGYLANYGQQSLSEDKLGMAILFREDEVIDVTEDSLSHVVILKPENGKLTYYFLAAWEQEVDGIKNKKEFIEYLDAEIAKLNSPIMVQYSQRMSLNEN